jgi:gamma-glutamylcyclotransferase
MPYDWYLALVIAGALESKLEANYVDFLQRTASHSDPDYSRSGRLEAIAVLEASGHNSYLELLATPPSPSATK